MSKHNFDFTNKEEYLKWVSEWKRKYKEISRLSREAKQERKQFTWIYRDPGVNTVKRKIKTTKNSKYDFRSQYRVVIYRQAANALLEQRKAAKAESNRLYWKSKKDERIAA